MVKLAAKTCIFLRILPPTVLQQIRLFQVASILTSDWMKLQRSQVIHVSDVTCCKTSLP